MATSSAFVDRVASARNPKTVAVATGSRSTAPPDLLRTSDRSWRSLPAFRAENEWFASLLDATLVRCYEDVLQPIVRIAVRIEVKEIQFPVAQRRVFDDPVLCRA